MLKAFLYLLLFVPFTLLIAASAIVATLFDSSGRLYRCHARLWSRIGLLLAGAKVVVTGRENIPEGPVIFMSNHQGNFDIFTLILSVPQQFAWIAKEELFRIPVFGHSLARAGHIPLNRDNSKSALRSVSAAADRIRNGQSVVLFPEGTRSTDGRLLPFKRGGFLIAAKAGVPIVPCTINGSIRINPPKKFHIQSGVVSIHFGTPIRSEARNETERQQLLEQVRAAIEANLEKEP